MLESFGDDARKAVVEAQVAATDLAQDQVTAWHLLIGLFDADPGIAELAAAHGLSPESVRTRGVGRSDRNRGGALTFDDSFVGVVRGARVEATFRRDRQITTHHLALALLAEPAVAQSLVAFGVDPEALGRELVPGRPDQPEGAADPSGDPN